MLKVKVAPSRNSIGIVLPNQKDFEQQTQIAEKVMVKYRNALHELAK